MLLVNEVLRSSGGQGKVVQVVPIYEFGMRFEKAFLVSHRKII